MDYKVHVKNKTESKEVQELFFELGYNKAKDCQWLVDCVIDFFATENNSLYCWDSEKRGEQRFKNLQNKELTIQQLKDLVVLKRNSTDDATHEGKHCSLWYLGDVKYGWRFDLEKWELDDPKNTAIKWGELKPISQLKDLVILERNDVRDATHTSYSKFYYLTNNEFYEYINNKWVNVDEFVDGLEFKAVSRDDVVNQLIQSQCPQDNLKMKEYLVPQEDGSYKLQLAYPLTAWKSWIEVPEGATVYAVNGDVDVFYKDDGYVQFAEGSWHNCNVYGDWLTYNDLKTFLRFGDGGKVVWERHSDVEQFKPSKPSDLFKDDCERGSDYPKMQTERILGVQIDEFSEVDDKQVEWLKQRVKSDNDNGKTITVTITPNDVKTDWFKKFLDGVKVQYCVIGSKGWQNLTWKSLEMMKLNVEFREKPTTVEVDGMKFDTVDKLTSYLKSMTNLK